MNLQDEEPEFRSRRFLVKSCLGHGGMGVVYEAVDRQGGASVALKTLLHLDGVTLTRFKDEFRHLQDVHHPNLVSLGEMVEEEGTWYFTMELVRGCNFVQHVRLPTPLPSLSLSWSPTANEEPSSLELPIFEDPAFEAVTQSDSTLAGAREDSESTALVEPPQPPSHPWPTPTGASATARAPGPQPLREQARFDEQRLRSALGQLALGLQALHRAGKVHRDIKASNILVNESGRVVLLDFGILSNAGNQSEATVAVGTPTFMAPEQVRGAPPAPAADWYSVGVLLYQCLTGRVPFNGPAKEVMEVKQRFDPPPPSSLVLGVPEDLERLCMHLLRREPERRPSGEQVLQWLGLQEAAARDEAWNTVSLPFVGRRAELRALYTAFSDSRQGDSVVVLVQGESGVGKTCLVRHFLTELKRQHPRMVTLSGRCYERESVPYKGVDGVVDSLAGLLAQWEASLWHPLLPENASTLAQLFPVLQEVPGFPYAGDTGEGELLQLRLAAFAALRELMARLAERQPVVLMLDDLQWADRDSAALLDELLLAPGLLLVATVRLTTEMRATHEVEDCRFWRKARSLVLEGLPTADAMSLVEKLVRGGLSAEHAQRIVAESGGMPIFIDALVRFRTDAGEQAASVRLEEALRARVGYLEPAARQLLELLVMADGPLAHAVAARAASLDPSDYGRLVSSVRVAHLALTSGPNPSDTIELFHDRIRQAVVPLIELPQQRLWHSRLALALESLKLGKAETLARHWRESGHLDRAIPYYLQAAREASAALAFSREAALYRTALELGTWDEAWRRRLYLCVAEALANAGRGGEAGQFFFTAAEGAPPQQALGLRQRAMEQYLLSGHIDEGLGMARKVLADLGIGYPETSGATIRAMLWQRMKLRLHPLRFRRREASQLPDSTLQGLAACASLADGLATVDPLRGRVFQAHYMLRALEAGEAAHLCCAISQEVSILAMTGTRNSARIRKLLALVEQLLPELEGDSLPQAYTFTTLGWRAFFFGELAHGLDLFERSLQLLQGCKGITLHLDRAWALGVGLLGMRGAIKELEQRLVLPVAGARERNNLYALLTLQLGYPTLCWLARGDPEGGRRAADELIQHWTKGDYTFQHYLHMYSDLYMDLYQGHSQRALQRLAEHMPRLKKAYLLTSQTILCRVTEARARAALMEAGRAGQGEAAREALLRQAEADARLLVRQGMAYARAQAELVLAGVAELRQRPEEAVQLYRRALRGLNETGQLLYAAAARLRLGELLGGDKGRAFAQHAQLWMKGQGILSPESMHALFVPAATARRPRPLPTSNSRVPH